MRTVPTALALVAALAAPASALAVPTTRLLDAPTAAPQLALEPLGDGPGAFLVGSATPFQRWTTTDAGTTLTPLVLPAGTESVSGDPHVGGVLWATVRTAERTFSVQRSTDGGATWLPQATVDGVDYAGVIGGGSLDRAFVRTDDEGAPGLRRVAGGAATPLAALDGEGLIAAAPSAPTTVYATSGEGRTAKLLRSTDGGATFQERARVRTASLCGGQVQGLDVDASAPGRLLLVACGRVLESTDGGATLRVVRGLPADGTRTSRARRAPDGGIDVLASGARGTVFGRLVGTTLGHRKDGIRSSAWNGTTLLADGPDALWRSTDDGRTWSALSGPLLPLVAGSVDGFATTRDGKLLGSGFGWLARVGAAAWQPVALPRPPHAADIADGGPSLYALQLGRAYRSDDDGATWRALPLPAHASFANGTITARGRRVAVLVATGIYWSANGGRSWRRGPQPAARAGAPEGRLHLTSRPAVAWRETAGAIWRTTTTGRTWRRVARNPFEGSAAATPDGARLVARGRLGIVALRPDGSVRLLRRLSRSALILPDAFAAGHVIAVATDRRALISANDGRTWRDVAVEAPGPFARPLGIAGGKLLYGGSALSILDA